MFILALLIPCLCLTQNEAKIDSIIKETGIDRLQGKDKTKKFLNLSIKSIYEDPFTGIAFAKKLSENAIITDDSSMYLQGLGMTATGYYFVSEYDSATKYFNIAVNFAEKIGATNAYLNLATNMGLLYSDNNKPELAVETYIKCMKLCRNIGNEKLYYYCINNIGGVYFKINDFEKAKEYYLQAMDYYKESGNSDDYAEILTNTGVIYFNTGFTDKAMQYYTKALKIKKKTNGDKIEILYMNLGDVYFDKKNYPVALDYFQQAALKYKNKDDKSGLAQVHIAISDVFLQMGQFVKSGQYAHDALEKSLQINSFILLRESYLQLSNVYAKQGKYAKAFQIRKLYENYKDSTFNENKSNMIYQMQMKYESEKKEKENVILINENKISRLLIAQKNKTLIWLVVLLIVFTLGIITILYLYHQKIQAYKVLAKKNLEKAKQETDYRIIDNANFDSSKNLCNKEYLNHNNSGIINNLRTLMVEKKPYLRADISIDEICLLLGTNRSYLSKAVNNELDLNFNEFINEYRIKTARQMLSDKKNNHLSLEGIGISVGFKSRTSFYRNFKKITGISPSFFRNSI